MAAMRVGPRGWPAWARSLAGSLAAGVGLAKGGAVGAGTGAVVNLSTRGHEVEFPAEQLLVFGLAVPAQLSVR